MIKKSKEYPYPPEEKVEELEKLLADALEAREKSEQLLETYKNIVNSKLIPAIKEYGLHTKVELPDDSILLVNNYKLQVLGKFRAKWTENEGIELMKRIKKAIEKAKELQQTISTPYITLKTTENGEIAEELRCPECSCKTLKRSGTIHFVCCEHNHIFVKEDAFDASIGNLYDKLVIVHEDIDMSAWKNTKIPQELAKVTEHKIPTYEFHHWELK